MRRGTPDWRRRGGECRRRRVDGTPYRTGRALAALIGVTAKDLSDMELGRADPAPLEAWWAALDRPPAPLPPLTVRCLDRVRELVALGTTLPCVERKQMRKLLPYLERRLAR